MAKFTSSAPLNIRWFGNEISGAAGATHRIPDAMYEEFNAAYNGAIPGLTWVTQDETTAFAGTDIASPITATSIKFKGNPWHDVTAYGATGNGSTNDAAAMASAITAAGVGGHIFVPPGTYKSASTLTLLAGQSLFGMAGRSILIRAAGMSVALVSATSVDDVTVADIVIDGGGSTGVANAANMLHLENVNRPRVDRVQFRNSPSSNPALMLLACNDGAVIGCDFRSTGYGVIIGLNPNDTRTCDRNVVANCTGRDIPTNALFYSASLDSSASTATMSANIASGNTFKSCGDVGIEFGIGNRDFVCVGNAVTGGPASRTGILIRDTIGGIITGNSVKGMRGTNADGIGVVKQLATAITDLTIGSNASRDNGRYGLFVQGAKRVSIAAGVYEGNGDTGIHLNELLDFTVTGVIVRSNGAYGMSIGTAGASVGRGTVIGCIAIDNGTSATATYDGFLIAGTGTTSILLSGCIATDSATASKKQRYGVNAFAGSEVTITNCRLEGNATGRISNNITTALSVDSGAASAFPSDGVTNERLYRHDRDIQYFFDGTRWLSQNLFHMSMSPGDIIPANQTATGVTGGRFAPPTQDYDCWLETLYVATYIASGNTSAAYWSFALMKTDGVSSTAVGTTTTQSDASATWISEKLAINALLGTANDIIELNASKTSTPGNWYMSASLSYRLVG